MHVANSKAYQPTHEGYLKIPTLGGGHTYVHSYYTKGIPATIISPFNALKRLRYHGCTTHVTVTGQNCYVRLSHPCHSIDDIIFPCDSVDGLLYSAPCIMPTQEERDSPLPFGDHVRTLRANAWSYKPPAPMPPPCSSCSPASEDKCSACATASASTACCQECADSPTDPSTPSCTDHSVKIDHQLSDQFLCYLRLGMMPDAPFDQLDPSIDHICRLDCIHCLDARPNAQDGTTAGEGTIAGEGIPTSVNDIDYDDRPPWPDYSGVNHCVCQMTAHQEQFLWHACLLHPSNYLYDHMIKHKTATGLPNSSSVVHELDNCPVCQKAKLTKAPRSKESSCQADVCYQGLSVDFGFIVQSSKDTKRFCHLQGYYGETCYVIITDHKSGTVFGDCFSSKAAPIAFLDNWLRKYGLPHNHPNKYVRLDGGGELGRNRKVIELFEKAGYDVERTAPDSSHQNGPGERPHRSIGNALCAILSGAGLEAHFCPFAFHHYLCIYNLVPHAKKLQSPYQICTGKVPDLSFLCVFGCRVYVLPPRPQRPSKLENDPNVGIFLGFSQTVKKIFYYDINSHEVKEGTHVAFDETSFDHQTKTPNAELLSCLRSGEDPSIVFDAEVSIPDLDVSLSPFIKTEAFQIPFKPKNANPLGISFANCDKLGRAFIADMTCKPTGRTAKAFKKHYRYSYIISIGEEHVYDTNDIDSIIQNLCALDSPPTHIDIVIASDRDKEIHSHKPSSMILRSHDIRHISAMLSVDNNTVSSTYE